MDAKFDMIDPNNCGSLINVVRGVTTSRAHSTSVMLVLVVMCSYFQGLHDR